METMPIPISAADLPPIVWARVRGSLRDLDAHRPLPADAVKALRDQLRVLHTYHSNAIEGNSLTLKETRLVLEEGITIGGKSLRDHLEATNNARAFEWVWDLAKPRLRVDHALIQHLHEMITRGILESAGRYRTEQVWIGGARHIPPQPAKIVPLLDAAFAEIPAIREPVLRSIYLHHRIAYVHPFLDGNGRVARLAANLALLSARYPPIVLRVSDRLRYYKYLQAADDGDLLPFASFVLRALDESLTSFLAARAVACPGETFPLFPGVPVSEGPSGRPRGSEDGRRLVFEPEGPIGLLRETRAESVRVDRVGFEPTASTMPR